MYQGGAVGGGGGDRIVVGPHVLVPLRPHGHVGGAELPQLGGLVEAGHEAPLLLRLRDVEKELDDLRAVPIDVALEGVDAVVAASPEFGPAIARGRSCLSSHSGWTRSATTSS